MQGNHWTSLSADKCVSPSPLFLPPLLFFQPQPPTPLCCIGISAQTRGIHCGDHDDMSDRAWRPLFLLHTHLEDPIDIDKLQLPGFKLSHILVFFIFFRTSQHPTDKWIDTRWTISFIIIWNACACWEFFQHLPWGLPFERSPWLNFRRFLKS